MALVLPDLPSGEDVTYFTNWHIKRKIEASRRIYCQIAVHVCPMNGIDVHPNCINNPEVSQQARNRWIRRPYR